MDFEFYITRLNEIISFMEAGIQNVNEVTDPDVKAQMMENTIGHAKDILLPRLSWDFQRNAALRHWEWYEPYGLVKVRR